MTDALLSIWRGDILMPAKRPGMAFIGAEVAEKYGLRLYDLTGPARTKKIAHPRQEAFHRIYATGCYSLPQIGRFFGNRDHTTVLQGIRAHERRMAEQ